MNWRIRNINEEAKGKFCILKHGGYDERPKYTFLYSYVLQGFSLKLAMPIKLIHKSDAQEVPGELKLAFMYQKRDSEKTKGGICYQCDGERIYSDECVVEEFALSIEDELYSSSKKTLYFEAALLDISRQMREKYYLKCCFTCQYSEYSPYGNDDFGNMICYRRHKEDCFKVNSKDEYFEYLEDKDFDIYQETYLCEEYAERIRCGGYRGFVEGVDSNPIFISSGLERELREISSCSKPSLSLVMVNLETTCLSAADMMQQSCLYLEISIPTKYRDIEIYLLNKYLSTVVFHREFGCVIT